MAARILQKAGYEVDIVGNGQEAVEAVEKGNYDLVFMDVQMPEMDGFEATREIRNMQNGGSDYIPIIAMTAHAMRGDREKCLAQGMDDYISKPIDPKELFEKLEKWTNPSVKTENKKLEVIL